ncbi:hypothetical protein OQA88_2933, partial [Cercophora sp. LCS_1]
MEDLMLSSKKPPPINWAELHDDIRDKTIGFSFVRDPRNQAAGKHLEGSESWIIRQLFEDSNLKNQWLEMAGGSIQFRTAKVNTYLTQFNQFREILLIAIHLLAGQPARTTEILNIRHTNTPYGGLRNIMILHGMVSIVTSYHKNYQLSGQVKIIYRFLPQEVGEVV